MRTFIAIELSENVRSALLELSARLRKSDVRASWVKSDAMHLTLRFLGEITTENVERLVAGLDEPYSAMEPFELTVKGTGAFPSFREPSVAWAGVEPLEGGLARAQTIAENAAQSIGLKSEKRRFHPHLTLARIKDPAGASRLTSLLAREKDFAGGSFQVESVTLFSSTLTPNGAVYERIKEFPFQCPRP